MNKKLLALAIAAALAPAAAMADSGNVKIGGVMHVSFDSLSDGNARNNNVSSNSSKITLSGDEDLGNGLKAIWNVDSYVRLDNSSSTLGNGNTFAGLTGGFGTALLGKHDTPMKLAGRKVDLFGDQIGDSRNMIGGTTNPASAGVTTNYVGDSGGIGDLRPQNVIAYISPTIGGFHGAIAHVTNVADDAANDKSTKAWSGLGMYEAGPMAVALAYEKHDVAGISSDPKQWRLVGGYNLGAVKLVGLYQKASNLGGSNIGEKVWGMGAAFKMGASTIKGQFYNAADATGCASGVDCSRTGARMYALGYDYSMSKRTTVYAAYAKVSNQDDAAYNPFAGGHGDNPGTAFNSTTGVTKDPSGLSVGLMHSF